MKAISTGNDYVIYDDSLKAYDQLPVQPYRVVFSKMRGFYLEKYIEPNPNEEKIYGDHLSKVDKVMKAFERSNRNLGVILSGAKGIGKTLFAKLLGLEAIKAGMPLLVVDAYVPGIAAYLESIDQQCMVFFDEFDKTFGGVKQADGAAAPQTEMLALFDGIANGKKLFVVTCNETHRLSDYLINRPGRFHYHFRFEYPTPNEITTYLRDKLPETQWGEIESIVAFAGRVPLNYDCLRAIAFELQDGSTFREAVKCLNIVNLQSQEYDVTCVLVGGKTLSRQNVSLDLYSGESPDLNFQVNGLGYIMQAEFDLSASIYDPTRLTTIVPADGVQVNWVYEANEDDKPSYHEWVNAINEGIDHVEIRRCMQRSIHYAV